MFAPQLRLFDRKIVVLDDDPTGVQTVHDISVYTDWSFESMLAGFKEPGRMFFVLTNSRSFSAKETEEKHREMVRNIHAASQITGKKFVIISRSDSTLRGHYPLETITDQGRMANFREPAYDGEIIYPFFRGRQIYDRQLSLCAGMGIGWCRLPRPNLPRIKPSGFLPRISPNGSRKRTGGAVPGGKCHLYFASKTCIPANMEGVYQRLMSVKGFQKVVVNSISYTDTMVFCAL
jgi:hypothetical protein